MNQREIKQRAVLAEFVNDLCASDSIAAMQEKSREMYLFLKSKKASGKHAMILPFLQDVLNPYLASAPKPPRKSLFYSKYQSEISDIEIRVNKIL